MSVTVLANGIASGMYIGAPVSAAITRVTLDTRTASAIFCIYTGGALHGYLPNANDAFTDSESNSWNYINLLAFGDGGCTTGSSTLIWCENPNTSATHQFQVTTLNPGQGKSTLDVVAFGDMNDIVFNTYTWTRSGDGSQVIVGPTSYSGLVFTYGIFPEGDVSAGLHPVPLLTSGWTAIDSQDIKGGGGSVAWAGLTIAYRLLDTPTSITGTFAYSGGGSAGAGLFGFSYTTTPTPPANEGAGIYKLVPNKTHDTLYLDATADPPTTEDVKIPNPSAEGYLAGDEL